MIKFYKLSKDEPYNIFKDYYDKALIKKQKNIEAVAISSLNTSNKEVNSRFVNLKYIKDDNWVFFTNYDSPKAKEFKMCNKIHAMFFWHELNVQIRIKAKIKKLSKKLSDEHFKERKFEKNVLAIVSNQSKKISSYEEIVSKFDNALIKNKHSIRRPNYWGGFSFKPEYFEFWTGHENRINKRLVFKKKKNTWDSFIVQP